MRVPSSRRRFELGILKRTVDIRGYREETPAQFSVSNVIGANVAPCVILRSRIAHDGQIIRYIDRTSDRIASTVVNYGVDVPKFLSVALVKREQTPVGGRHEYPLVP